MILIPVLNNSMLHTFKEDDITTLYFFFSAIAAIGFYVLVIYK